MKLLILLSWISLLMPRFAIADESDPWVDYSRVSEVILGEDPFSDDHKLTIQLLEPLASLGSGVDGAEIGEKNVSIYSSQLGDHGFVYTAEGELFVDNLFVGRFKKTDDLHYGYGRFWANGKLCTLLPLTKKQKSMLFEDWEIRGVINQVEREPWKIFITPLGKFGGGGSGYHIRSNGMTVLRFDQGVLHVSGVPFGPVAKGDEIRVVDGAVSINGQLRFPTQRKMEQRAEQPADGKTPEAPKLPY